ncbi:MAG: MauE/DoxX family redox-associated membrane protein [Pseudomonadota bacterium]
MTELTEIAGLHNDPVVVYAARLAMGLLFGLAAIAKIRHHSVFRATLADYELVPSFLLVPAALLVVLLEVGIAVGAFFEGVASVAMLMAGGLLLLYAAAIGINLLRGRRDIDCGCTGPAVRQSLSAWLLVRNTGLAMVAGFASTIPSGRVIGLLDITLVAVIIGAAVVIYAAANQLMINAPRLDALDDLLEPADG